MNEARVARMVRELHTEPSVQFFEAFFRGIEALFTPAAAHARRDTVPVRVREALIR